jgi:hypothetical protein
MTVSDAIQKLRELPGNAEIEGAHGFSLDANSGKVKIDKAVETAEKPVQRPKRFTEPENG